jgi:hypothetical protein
MIRHAFLMANSAVMRPRSDDFGRGI